MRGAKEEAQRRTRNPRWGHGAERADGREREREREAERKGFRRTVRDTYTEWKIWCCENGFLFCTLFFVVVVVAFLASEKGKDSPG